MDEATLAGRVRCTLVAHGLHDSAPGGLDTLVRDLVATLTAPPTEADARAAGMDLLVDDEDSYRSLRARGVVHRIAVMPNNNRTGWIVDVSAPSGAANLPQRQAVVLAHLLLSGPGEDWRATCAHGLVLTSVCTPCLSEN